MSVLSFEALFRSAPNAYVVLAPDLSIIDANRAYLELTGRSLEEIRGRRLHEAFAPDPRQPEAGPSLLASLDRVLQRKKPDTLPVIQYSIARHTPEGPVLEDRYWSATHTPLFDEHGEVSAILQNTSDITELVKAGHGPSASAGQPPLVQLEEGVISRALKVQDEGDQLRRLFSQTPGFVCFMRGPEHVVEMFNDAFRSLVGDRPLMGMTVRQCFPDLEGQLFIGLLDRVYESGEAYVGRRMPISLRQQGGVLEEMFVDFVYQPIVEVDGRVSGIFIQGSDVTMQQRSEAELEEYRLHLERLVERRTCELQQSEADRQVAEAALLQAQKLEAVGKLTGGVAHAFNNMLQIIGGNLQLLRRNLGTDPVAQRRLDSAVGSVERGARLASQLLAFSSRQSLQPQPLDLADLVEQMVDLLSGSLGQGIDIQLDLDRQAWPVLADKSNLESVILNLAANASDAMGGRGRLLIRVARHSSHDGQQVLLSVVDEGCGMSAEVRKQAFEPFFTTKRDGGSSGLGLSVVYGFIKQTGGSIELIPVSRGGTEVRVCFPRHPDSPAAAGGRAAPEGPAEVDMQAETGGLRILFVEDDPTLRMLTGEVMAELGHSVYLGETAEEALDQFDRESFDVLFTDIGLPGMSGLELARRVREKLPGLEIVIASGYAIDVRAEALDGVHAVLKPYDIERVRALLDGIQGRLG
ncbi:PAS domain-containing protein [Stutzerimonas tarimensis]|uniref:histidine kinase n=1 Tax=Stutzerimonas tarimensis TaxID=1507735 RepID=A0ABV7T5S9_9GAMM